MNRSALFSEDRLYRYFLYRGWDESLPTALLIGLNPSTANESTDDPTIRRLSGQRGLLAHNGFGNLYMMNLFPIVSADPKVLSLSQAKDNIWINDEWLRKKGQECAHIIFCWGNFEVYGRDKEITNMFPEAMTFGRNKNGSPKHPLYLKTSTTLQA